MLGINRGTAVKYQCSRRASARIQLLVCFCVLLFIGSLALLKWHEQDMDAFIGILFAGSLVLLYMVWPAYRYFRPGLETRTVMLGGWAHRLYLRSRPLFLLCTGSISAVVVLVVKLLFDWMEKGSVEGLWADYFDVKFLVFLAFCFVAGAAKSYGEFASYYKWLRTQK